MRRPERRMIMPRPDGMTLRPHRSDVVDRLRALDAEAPRRASIGLTRSLWIVALVLWLVALVVFVLARGSP